MIVVQWVRFALAALLMIWGLISLFTTVVGIFRLGYVLNRIHIAATCDTFGVLLTFSSLALMYGWSISSVKLLLIIVFYWISNPVSSHLVTHLEVVTNPQVKEECEVIPYDPD